MSLWIKHMKFLWSVCLSIIPFINCAQLYVWKWVFTGNVLFTRDDAFAHCSWMHWYLIIIIIIMDLLILFSVLWFDGYHMYQYCVLLFSVFTFASICLGVYTPCSTLVYVLILYIYILWWFMNRSASICLNVHVP